MAALAGLLTRDGLAAESGTGRAATGGAMALPHFAPKAKRVIYLFQNGAPTHVDLFDYKPKLAGVAWAADSRGVRRRASGSAP